MLRDAQRQALGGVAVLWPGVVSTVEHRQPITGHVMTRVLATVRRRIQPVARTAVVDDFLVDASAGVKPVE